MQLHHLFPAALFFTTAPAFAVSPLITDDADTVPAGEFEFVLTSGVARADGFRSNPLLATLTYGITLQLEAGVEFGGLWQREGGDRENGWADTTLSAKWKFSAEEEPAFLGAAFAAVKLPTASQSKGLGSGDPDYTLGLIGTWAPTAGRAIDMNVAYTSMDNLKLAAAKDALFLGLGIREEVHESFTLVGEIINTMPANGFSGSALQARAGFQWEVMDAGFIDFAYGHGIGANHGFREATLGMRFEF